MIDWTEKYRPKTLHQIVGNHNQIRKLQSWATSWKQGKPVKKAVVLSGKPGIGKTSAAYALSHDFHWLPIELNASDARNATTINAVATAGATHQTFSDNGDFVSTKFGGRKLIIIDEADNLFERAKESAVNGKDFGDRDGKRTIVKTVQITSQPVVLIVNDDYQLFKGRGTSLRKDCLHLKMYKAKSFEIVQLLKHICSQENVHVDSKVLLSISDSCDGDIRSAVRDLQSLCTNKEMVTTSDFDVIGRRDRTQQIFDALQDIFQIKDSAVIQQKVKMVQEDPRMILLWVAENLPKSYSSVEDISQGFDWLSRSDMFLGRTYRRNYYGLWSYACDLSTVGVALSKHNPAKRTRYQFPSWLKQTSRHKNVLSAQQSLIEKLSLYHHCSYKKTRSYILPHLKAMASSDDELLITIVEKLGLSNEEAIVLAGNNAKRALSKKKNTEKTSISSQKQVKIDDPINKKGNKQNKDKDNSLKQQSLGLF
jgi:replication factor C large subunit